MCYFTVTALKRGNFRSRRLDFSTPITDSPKPVSALDPKPPLRFAKGQFVGLGMYDLAGSFIFVLFLFYL